MERQLRPRPTLYRGQRSPFFAGRSVPTPPFSENRRACLPHLFHILNEVCDPLIKVFDGACLGNSQQRPSHVAIVARVSPLHPGQILADTQN